MLSAFAKFTMIFLLGGIWGLWVMGCDCGSKDSGERMADRGKLRSILNQAKPPETQSENSKPSASALKRPSPEQQKKLEAAGRDPNFKPRKLVPGTTIHLTQPEDMNDEDLNDSRLGDQLSPNAKQTIKILERWQKERVTPNDQPKKQPQPEK